jgi:pyruvate/2-oxoglutarate dehydrogenase complex dihydrolipoamide acyltransferase (E2) component
MSISSIGYAGSLAYDFAISKPNTQAQSSASQASASDAASPDGSVEQQFLDYMKKSPAQRFVDAWLKAHHLTQKDLDEMTPEKREAVMKQMAHDFKEEMKRKAEAGLNGKAGVLV